MFLVFVSFFSPAPPPPQEQLKMMERKMGSVQSCASGCKLVSTEAERGCSIYHHQCVVHLPAHSLDHISASALSSKAVKKDAPQTPKTAQMLPDAVVGSSAHLESFLSCISPLVRSILMQNTGLGLNPPEGAEGLHGSSQAWTRLMVPLGVFCGGSVVSKAATGSLCSQSRAS